MNVSLRKQKLEQTNTKGSNGFSTPTPFCNNTPDTRKGGGGSKGWIDEGPSADRGGLRHVGLSLTLALCRGAKSWLRLFHLLSLLHFYIWQLLRHPNILHWIHSHKFMCRPTYLPTYLDETLTGFNISDEMIKAIAMLGMENLNYF